VHFVVAGEREGQAARPSLPGNSTPHLRLLPWMARLAVETSPQLAGSPALNIVFASARDLWDGTGPAAAFRLAAAAAGRGLTVRLLSADPDFSHAFERFRIELRARNLEIPDALAATEADDPSHPALVGARDLFLATSWQSAQQVKALADAPS